MANSDVRDDMIAIPGGRFAMGSDDFYPEEAPRREVEVAPFHIAAHAVSAADFAGFVSATGYLTTAEQPLPPELAPPDTPPHLLAPGSLVFHPTSGPVPLSDFHAWWRFVEGACWHQPEGPGSTLDGRMDHPVTHISAIDARAYCDWAGLRLPTEKEWEFAARGGVETLYPWGDHIAPEGRLRMNTWWGDFPYQNIVHNAGPFTLPVGSLGSSGYGTYNMLGNVWEWTTTRSETRLSREMCCTPKREIQAGEMLVVKGGSHLCAPSYCQRYRRTALSVEEARSSTSHIGFRCAG
ncbi:formylglycine-generating enzyme family protein [Paracoccaceae bacterium GXU_MW_L88]